MKTILWSVASLMLCACGGSQPETSQNNLADTQWVWTAYSENTGVKTRATRYITAHFKVDNKVAGETPCGAFSGNYQIEQGLVTISNLKSSNQTCGAAADDTYYFDRMQAVKSYTRQDKHLTLAQGDGQQLVFASKFLGCDNPMPVTGNQGVLPVVQIQTLNSDIDGLVSKFEQQYPDFILQNTGSCSLGIVAQVNPNTLSVLRCDNSVASLTYQ